MPTHDLSKPYKILILVDTAAYRQTKKLASISRWQREVGYNGNKLILSKELHLQLVLSTLCAIAMSQVRLPMVLIAPPREEKCHHR